MEKKQDKLSIHKNKGIKLISLELDPLAIIRKAIARDKTKAGNKLRRIVGLSLEVKLAKITLSSR